MKKKNKKQLDTNSMMDFIQQTMEPHGIKGISFCDPNGKEVNKIEFREKKMKKKQCVILVGNVVDGMRIIGPFESESDDAMDYADQHLDDETWVVADIEAPEDE